MIKQKQNIFSNKLDTQKSSPDTISLMAAEDDSIEMLTPSIKWCYAILTLAKKLHHNIKGNNIINGHGQGPGLFLCFLCVNNVCL